MSGLPDLSKYRWALSMGGVWHRICGGDQEDPEKPWPGIFRKIKVVCRHELGITCHWFLDGHLHEDKPSYQCYRQHDYNPARICKTCDGPETPGLEEQR